MQGVLAKQVSPNGFASYPEPRSPDRDELAFDLLAITKS